MQIKPNCGSSGKQFKKTKRRAFSRVDLVVTLGALVLLAAWFGFAHLGERDRMLHCANNLRAQGQAMHEFANDHGDGIPAAVINLGNIRATWDELLKQYLNPRSPNHLLRFYVCPSDTAPHQGIPRSYAMGRNDMLPKHWPPGGDSATGAGLRWNEATVRLLLNNEAAFTNLDLLVPVKLSNMPVPSDTLLTSELINSQNVVASIQQATVSGVSQQQKFFQDGGAQFHYGRFNYLMGDGHVETLSALQTGSVDGSGGIWTLKKEK